MSIDYSWYGDLRDHQLSQCGTCGAAIADEKYHTDWHNELRTVFEILEQLVMEKE